MKIYLRLFGRVFWGILLLLVFLQYVFAAVDAELSQRIYESDELVIYQHIGGDIEIQNSDKLTEVQTSLHLLPIDDYRQTVVDQNFSPEPTSLAESLAIFTWKNSIRPSMSFSVNSLVKTRNTYKQVTRQVKYPIEVFDLPIDVTPYLHFTELVDFDKDVDAKAKELASSDKDLFVVAFNVAQWVSSNIQYDLATITADATQNASWVFDKRRGVCDELSVLYISMMRSLGIPARFVSGISYTNSPLFSDPWSPHAWVEVYFPDYGWVPFDLTYKQFGYIDAGHISMQNSADANDSSTRYKWQGFDIKNVLLDASPLIFESKLLDSRRQKESFVKQSVRLLRDSISLKSSSAIVVTLQNIKNYYVSVQLAVGAPSELNFGASRDIQLLLKPFEERTIYIPISITGGLSYKYNYQFPIVITNFYQVLANTTLYVAASNPTYTTSEVDSLIQNSKAASLSKISSSISTQCSTPAQVIINKSFELSCDIENGANVSVTDFEICFGNECTKSTLRAKSINTIAHNFTYQTVGIKQIPIKLRTGSRIQETLVDVVVKDFPALSVSVVTSIDKIRYDDVKDITLLIQKNSFSTPQRVVARIFNDIPYIWQVGTLINNRELTATISGSSLDVGVNDVPINVVFYDLDGKKYNYETSIRMELVDVSIWQRILIFLRKVVS